jgi:hypothetical protein
LAPTALNAQTITSGTVLGVVTDPSHATVPGAEVKLEKRGTNAVQTTVTDSAGSFLFAAVDPGDYVVRFSAKGFRSSVVNDVRVQALKSFTVNITLELGAATETVEVVASSGAELQTSDASIGVTFSGDALLRLPAQQRSITAILLMQPGVSPAMPTSAKDDINGGQVAGANADQTTFFVDGGDATSDLEGTNNYVSPPGEPQPSPFIAVPAETVQEFRLVTASPTASFSRSTGGEVSVLTKSGSNTLHGSAYEYYYGSGTSANDWQLNSIGRHRPHAVNNRYGTSAGGPIWKNKLFIYGNYEGRRFYQNTTITQLVPTDSARAGIIKLKDTTGAVQSYSLTPGSVSSNCGAAGNVTCDPRGFGVSPLITSYFALLPEPNNFSAGDGVSTPGGLNSAGYTASFANPVIEDIAIGRVDYKINPNWSLFGTYHYNRYRLSQTNQFDITKGVPKLVSKEPVEPRLVTFMLQGQVSPHFTSQTHGSYMRDYWAWTRAPYTPQLSGTTGIINLSGEARLANIATSSKVWGDPINFDTQDARTRFWWGKDYYVAQDSTWVHNKHTIQFGGGYWFWNMTHQRTDIVTGGVSQGPTYYVGETTFNGGSFVNVSAVTPHNGCKTTAPVAGCLTTNNGKRWANMFASLTGMVDRASQVGVRDGNFVGSPLGSQLIDHVHTHSFETYVQDVWKVRHSLTITYGLSYGVQFAPTELNGKQVLQVFANSGQPLSNLNAYFQQRNAALGNGQYFASGTFDAAGNLTDNTWGFSPIRHVPGRGSSGTTNWNNLGPRVAVAWQVPYNNRIFGNGQTVIRGGYSILWNRTNGVAEALIPLLGDGLASAQLCNGPTFNGTTTATCSGAKTTELTGFRLGVDGSTAPIPGVTNAPIPLIPPAPFGAHSNVLDPALKTPYSHNVTLDIQRAFAHNMLLDIGFIGRYARNLTYAADIQSANLYARDPKSGQQLWQAYNAINAAVNAGITPYLLDSLGKPTTTINPAFPQQPFFENSTFGCPTCSNAIALADGGDVSLATFMLNNYDQGLSDPAGNFLGPARPLDPLQMSNDNMTATGSIANYNALFVTFRKSTSQGLDMSVNYTWSHAVGTGGQNFIGQQYAQFSPPTPFNLFSQWGSNNGDRRHVLNASAYYVLPFGRGKRFSTSSSILNRVIGGWYTSGVWTWETGLAFCVGADGDYGSPNGFTCAVGTPLFGKATPHRGIAGSGRTLMNLFSDPAAAFGGLRAPLPGVDNRPGAEILNLPRSWNIDLSVGKNVYSSERFKVVFSAESFNAFNHPIFGTTPGSVSMDLADSAGFGVISRADNAARSIQLGLRFEF